MKKLTTLFAFMLSAMFVSAQDVVITNNGIILEDKAVVEVEAYEIIDEEPEWNSAAAFTYGVDPNGNILPNQLYLKNQTSIDQPVNLTITVLSKENVTGLGVCTLNSCMGIPTTVFTKQGTISGSGESPENNMLNLDAHFTFGTPGYVKFQVDLQVGLTQRTLFVNMNYTPGGSGVHSTLNDAELSMNGNNIIYKLAEAGQHTIDVYNVTGSLVKSVEVGQEGTLSLEGLSKGIYIYTAKTNGKQVAVQKCIIK